MFVQFLNAVESPAKKRERTYFFSIPCALLYFYSIVYESPKKADVYFVAP